jgi:hypothetical protein
VAVPLRSRWPAPLFQIAAVSKWQSLRPASLTAIKRSFPASSKSACLHVPPFRKPPESLRMVEKVHTSNSSLPTWSIFCFWKDSGMIARPLPHEKGQPQNDRDHKRRTCVFDWYVTYSHASSYVHTKCDANENRRSFPQDSSHDQFRLLIAHLIAIQHTF